MAVKDAAGDPAASARLLAEVPDGFDLYSGDDALTLPLLAIGAAGVISVAAHWASGPIAEMISAFFKGDVDHARRVNAGLIESWSFQTGDAHAESHSDQSHAAGPRPACRAVPSPARPVPRGARGPGPGRAQPAAGRGRATLADPVRLVFLGGLGEIGRNCACIEVDGRIMLLDCGLMFPDLEMPGIDLVLPDFTYLLDNKERVEACILTHGHEDHVGGLSFLLRELEMPDLRLAAHPRPGPQPDRGGRPARPHRPSIRSGTASGAGSARSTWSSSRSPIRCPTASPPPSTPPRA